MRPQKKYVDDRALTQQMADYRYLSLNGGGLKGNLNIRSNGITNVANPTSLGDALNKEYADLSFLSKSGDSMTGNLSLAGQHKVTNLASPTDGDAATKKYVDANKGSALTWELDTKNHKIVRLADPVNPRDSTNRSWVETHAVGNYLPLGRGTLSGVLNMGNHKVTHVSEPRSNDDAATKIWVENNFPTKTQMTPNTFLAHRP